MSNSLQEQLLQAGLVSKNQLEKANKEKGRQQRQQRAKKSGKAEPVDPEVRRRQAEKAARDRELNAQREMVRRQRETAAQVRQLVREHRHPRPQRDDDIPFNFENKGKIKRLYVSADTHKLISSGRLVIVNDNGVFELVPPEIAAKIRQRNPSLVIDLPDEASPAPDDPYADFKVPDDLMW